MTKKSDNYFVNKTLTEFWRYLDVDGTVSYETVNAVGPSFRKPSTKDITVVRGFGAFDLSKSKYVPIGVCASIEEASQLTKPKKTKIVKPVGPNNDPVTSNEEPYDDTNREEGNGPSIPE